MQKNILIVEDDPTLSDVLLRYLSDAGYECAVICDGLKVESWFLANKPDMVLLDVVLPGVDGIQLCQLIRNISNVPILMITGKAEEEDRLKGLGSGADDYICKPFRPREVVARVGTIFKRVQPNYGIDTTGDSASSAGLFIYMDLKRQTLRVGDRTKLFTRAQASLLHFLMECEGKVVSRGEIIKHLRSKEDTITERTIDSHVRELRKGISEIIPGKRVIFSIYGEGYKFERPLELGSHEGNVK